MTGAFWTKTLWSKLIFFLQFILHCLAGRYLLNTGHFTKHCTTFCIEHCTAHCIVHCTAHIHQTSPIPEGRLTGGGSLNLVDLIVRKVRVERKMGAANSVHSFFPRLYTCFVQAAYPKWFSLLCCCWSFFPQCWDFLSTRKQPMGEPPHTSSLALL